MEIVARRGAWNLKIQTPSGPPKFRSLGFPAIPETLKAATAEAVRIIQDPSQLDFFADKRPVESGTLFELQKRFEEEERFPTKETRQGYIAHLKSVLAFEMPGGVPVGETPLSRFHEPGVYSWLCGVATALENAEPRPAYKTRRHRISSLMRLLRWAGPEKAGVIPAPPRTPVVPKLRNKDGEPVDELERGARDRCLEPDEFWAAMRALEKHFTLHGMDREKILGKLGYPVWAVSTGAHLKDCRNLTGGLIPFHATDEPRYVNVNSKNKFEGESERMPAPAAELISRLVKIRGRSFGQRERVFSPWSDSSVSHAMRTAADLAGIEHFQLRDLRATFATWCARAGMEEWKLVRLMGHSSARMIHQVYLRWARPAAANIDAADVVKSAPAVTTELRAIS